MGARAHGVAAPSPRFTPTAVAYDTESQVAAA
jgi:hypothetical protein